jgi:hypothetical protein
MRIVLPKTFCEIDQTYGPLFFLAGPVQGGGNWQTVCAEEIKKQLPNFYAAIPCSDQEVPQLTPFKVNESAFPFEYQLNWERHYLDLAAATGCIIFWLPGESKINPRTGDGPYATDTRGELGEWRGCLRYNPNLRVVIGAEPDFYGTTTIKRNFSLATNSNFPIYDTLEETVAAAIQKTK